VRAPPLRPLLVAAFGAAGALSRYGIGVAVGPRAFPWGTLAINVVGAFLLGWLLGGDRFSTTTTVALGAGFLGAFTTFSTFAWEATALVREDRAGAALGYVGASVALGLGASALGYLAAR
jgi:fluoride exporter